MVGEGGRGRGRWALCGGISTQIVASPLLQVGVARDGIVLAFEMSTSLC